ncbi:FadR/GntR family transcriptional regulator [Pseudoxanthobacter sp.]|uniref:FadR/GntR family transcriptional regulator n=1 Tax=Pseudoxanthobacter sp. TaxID=1925742 RepID=UPI002FE25E74
MTEQDSAGSPSPVTQSTVTVLQNMIRSGELRVGDCLPPQRELAGRLNVSRSSLREALSVLEAVGMLRTRPRKGTYVSEPGEAASASPEPGQPRGWSPEALYSPAEAYQFRFVVEGHAARLTAIRASDEAIAALRVNFGQLKEAVRAGEFVTYSQHDFDFHRMIMSFSENRLYLDLYDRYASVFRDSQRLPLAWHRRLWEPVSEHENIIRAIENRDPDSARYFMHMHIMRAANRVGIVLDETV